MEPPAGMLSGDRFASGKVRETQGQIQDSP